VQPAEFEPAFLASERPQTHSLDRAASGNGSVVVIGHNNYGKFYSEYHSSSLVLSAVSLTVFTTVNTVHWLLQLGSRASSVSLCRHFVCFFTGGTGTCLSASAYVLSCQYYSSNILYFCVPCQYYSTIAQCFCVSLSTSFQQCPVLLCIPVSTILPLPSTCLFPCQHHSTSSQYFCVPLSVPPVNVPYFCVAVSVLFLQYSLLAC
jgi:hypothetical protein